MKITYVLLNDDSGYPTLWVNDEAGKVWVTTLTAGDYHWIPSYHTLEQHQDETEEDTNKYKRVSKNFLLQKYPSLTFP